MDIFLVREKGIPYPMLEHVQKLFQRHEGPLVIKPLPDPVELQANGEGGTLAWADVFTELGDLRRQKELGDAPFLHLLTATDNESNWYAAEDEACMRNAFIHSGDFSWVTSAPRYAINAHWILKAVFNALLDEAGVDWEKMWHQRARGCFFDFCEEKGDLALKLRTGDICEECMTTLQDVGLPDDLLRQSIQIMESIRKLAVNTGPYIAGEPTFQAWPYPVAITRHRAAQATSPLLRLLRLLDHFDSLVRYVYLVHQTVRGRRPEIEDRPSLGWWVGALGRVVRQDADLRQAVTIAERKKVVHLRNERRGHGWLAPDEEGYERDADDLEKIIRAIEDELSPFLEEHLLVIPKEVRPQDGVYMIAGSLLVGSNGLHETFRKNLATGAIEAGITDVPSVYVTDRTFSKFHRISPLIRRDTCPECRHSRVLINDGGRTYIDVSMGHRVNL